MWGTKTSELFTWLRLNRAAALVSLIAVLSQALVPSGWMPVFAATPDGGISVVICTAQGTIHVQLGADGQPIKQTPLQDQAHGQQCCPCVASGPFAPPANTTVFLVLHSMGTARASATAQDPLIGVTRTPHSPRAPPVLA
jgi:hypothetical protein